jgi:hypothetical protein
MREEVQVSLQEKKLMKWDCLSVMIIKSALRRNVNLKFFMTLWQSPLIDSNWHIGNESPIDYHSSRNALKTK